MMTGKSLSERIGDLGHRLAVEAHAAWLAARDSRVPWPARILAIMVAAYALSPIDLIPDFIPVLGHLDDALIVPLLVALSYRLIPAHVKERARARAEKEFPPFLTIRRFPLAVIATWTVVLFLAVFLLVLVFR